MDAKISLEKEALRAYRNRWQSVAKVEAAEQQSATLAERWQQLNALLQMAHFLELPVSRGQESEDPYRNWYKIRLIYLKKLDQPS
jgi:hypothetical protein